MTDLAIETRGLIKTFRGVEAVRGIDLAVRRNTIFGFLGPNGAGKTTTIKLLLGLARPTAGTAWVFGQDIGSETLEIRRKVGYLAQDPRYYEHMTARETLRFTARFFFEGPHRAIEHRIDETLDLVGLSGRADRPIKGFSGGERQRLGIAQAQINRPSLLILDEPAASLDPMGRRDVLSIMSTLRDHTTIFYSTHILEDVQRVSDTVAIMHQGRLVANAPIRELLAGNGEVSYQMRLRGATEALQERLEAHDWVLGVDTGPEDAEHGAPWEVRVSDPAAAEAELLRVVLADDRVRVVTFGRRTYGLEEVFMQVISEAA